MPEKSTPSSLKYYMPAEWEPHSDTWLAWPHNLETWSKKDLHEVEDVYIEIIRNLIDGEQINILINDQSYRDKIVSRLHNNKIDFNRINFHIILTEDAWIRDFGPNFLARDNLTGREIAVNRWRFNSWGGKYPWGIDDNAKLKIVRDIKLPWFDPGIILEGGAIDVNGKGTCLTTKSCLLNPNRNEGLSITKMEYYLKNYLGVKNIIWLDSTLDGDDTDGHVDNLARFVNPSTILFSAEENKNDTNYLNLNSLKNQIKVASNMDGKPFTIISLPMPRAIMHKNSRLPASYANFYIGNHAVLIPSFNDPNDHTAKDILKMFFPKKKIVPIDSRILLRGLGGLHCITQQQPAHSLVKSPLGQHA